MTLQELINCIVFKSHHLLGINILPRLISNYLLFTFFDHGQWTGSETPATAGRRIAAGRLPRVASPALARPEAPVSPDRHTVRQPLRRPRDQLC
jgi:hypothetical protein